MVVSWHRHSRTAPPNLSTSSSFFGGHCSHVAAAGSRKGFTDRKAWYSLSIATPKRGTWLSVDQHSPSECPLHPIIGLRGICRDAIDVAILSQSAGCSMPNGMNSSTAIILFDLCSQSTSPKLPPCHFQSPSKGPPMVIICCLSGSMQSTVSALLGIQYLSCLRRRFDVVCRLLQPAHAQS